MNKIKVKLLIIILLTIMGITLLSAKDNSIAMTAYHELDFVTGIVTASSLNIRQGPGTNFGSIGFVYKNEYIRIFARYRRLVCYTNRK